MVRKHICAGEKGAARSLSALGSAQRRAHPRLGGKALVAAIAAVGLLPAPGRTASHREAPVTSFDRTADITDFFAFRSPDAPDTVTAIMCTDPLLEPANGPNFFPFDPEVVYEISVDNDHDAVEDLGFVFVFPPVETRLKGVPVGAAGAGNGVPAPMLSPAPIAPGTPLIPPAITALDGKGSEGLGIRQSYQVALRRGEDIIELRPQGGGPLIAVPSNVGPRTMPQYDQLYKQGVRQLSNGVKVFAGTVDDAFFIDLGAAFDSLNFRQLVLSDEQDAADDRNFQPDDVSGYNVNCLAVQMPIAMITANRKLPTDKDELRQVGLWATTSRSEMTARRPERAVELQGGLVQVQRMANPLVNELLIPTEMKDLWSRSIPSEDSRFQKVLFDPIIVRLGQAALSAGGVNIKIPTPPRTDLAPLVQYTSGPKGPLADILRLDLSIPPTPVSQRSRLGGCGGDPGGFPNGRRLTDDVTDCFLRVGFGLLVEGFNTAPYNRLGDGVNVNDMPIREVFPYLAPAQSGRESRHVDPGEPGSGSR